MPRSGGVSSAWAGLTLAACLGGLSAAPLAPGEPAPPPPELPDPLPFEGSVKDPVFAVLIGLLDSDGSGRLSGERLEREVRRRGVTSRLPYRRVAWVSRRTLEPGRTAEITLQFLGAVDVPVPYSILGYHPGRVHASATCRLRERSLGGLVLGRRDTPFDDVRLFSVEEGALDVDVDGWLDFLAGSALDDTQVTGLAVLRRERRRLGLAFGHNRNRQDRAGVFDFGSDRILFPAPAELKGVAGELRRRVQVPI